MSSHFNYVPELQCIIPSGTFVKVKVDGESKLAQTLNPIDAETTEVVLVKPLTDYKKKPSIASPPKAKKCKIFDACEEDANADADIVKMYGLREVVMTNTKLAIKNKDIEAFAFVFTVPYLREHIDLDPTKMAYAYLCRWEESEDDSSPIPLQDPTTLQPFVSLSEGRYISTDIARVFFSTLCMIATIFRKGINGGERRVKFELDHGMWKQILNRASNLDTQGRLRMTKKKALKIKGADVLTSAEEDEYSIFSKLFGHMDIEGIDIEGIDFVPYLHLVYRKGFVYLTINTVVTGKDCEPKIFGLSEFTESGQVIPEVQPGAHFVLNGKIWMVNEFIAPHTVWAYEQHTGGKPTKKIVSNSSESFAMVKNEVAKFFYTVGA